MEDLITKWLFDPLVGKFVALLIGIVIIGIIVNILKKILSKYIVESDHRYKTKKFVNFIGYFFIVGIIIIIFSDRLSGITVALGVAGAGIAFALQEVIASIAGWLAILFGGFYKTGDRVQLGGIKGDVIDIGVLRTTLMEMGQWVDADLYNGRIVRIANSFVFKEPVFNYSADFPFLWDEIKIPIKFGSDYNYTRKLINDVAHEIVGEYSKFAENSWKDMVRKYLIEEASTKPMVSMIANDNWIEFTLRYVVDYKKRRFTKDMIFSRIIEEIEKNKEKMGIASATLHLVETPTLNVNLNK